VAYTFSKNLGIRSDSYRRGPVESAGRGASVRQTLYGILGTDRTHIVNVAYSIRLPDVKAGGFAQALFGGWQISGSRTWSAGRPCRSPGTSTSASPGRARRTEHHPGGLHRLAADRDRPRHLCDPGKSIPSGFLFNPDCFGLPNPASRATTCTTSVAPGTRTTTSRLQELRHRAGRKEAPVPDPGLQRPEPPPGLPR